LKKIVTIAGALLTLAGAAFAQDPMGGLGFRSGQALDTGPVGLSASPTVGVRQWFSPKMGVDAAIGFTTFSLESNGTTTDEGTGFSVDIGVPFSLKSWEKVNFIFRPGFIWANATLKDKTVPTPPNELTASAFAVSGEFEVEWMLAEKVSISAAHGIAYSNAKVEDNDSPVNEAKLSGFNTIGASFTQVGFHVYLW
jgi:hypothetical protein